MSDYTPITEDVRETYIEGRNAMFDYSDDPTDEYWAAEFDRWFQSIMHKAHIAERERTIALIEAKYATYPVEK